jgi:hypothetical protein
MFLILAAMLATLLISGFVSRLGLAGLELNLMLPEHISARRKVRAGIRLKNLKSWIPSFSIHLAGAAESGFDSILYFPGDSRAGRRCRKTSTSISQGAARSASAAFNSRRAFPSDSPNAVRWSPRSTTSWCIRVSIRSRDSRRCWRR